MRIGIDLGGTKIEGIALSDAGVELARHRVATPRDYDGTLDAITALVRTLEHETAATGSVGLGIPGAVSPATGLVKNANSVWLIGKPLVGDLEARLARAVRVTNDADVANACLFLASDVSRQITGVDLPVDGGWAAL